MTLPREVDHLIFSAGDLDQGMALIEGLLGVRPALGGRHPDYGTWNALVSLGPTTYLEILAPDPAARVDAREALPFGLDPRRDPRIMAWMTKAEDIEARVAGARGRGLEVGPVRTGKRVTADGRDVSWRITNPHRVHGDGIVPYLIDWGGSAHPAASAPSAGSLVSLQAEHPDPSGVVGLLRAMEVDLTVSHGPSPALVAVVRTPRGEVEIR